MPNLKLGHIELFVNDPSRSKQFYRDVLLFEVIDEQSENHRWLKSGSFRLGFGIIANMSRTLSQISQRRDNRPIDEHQHMVLDDVSWNFYEQVLKEIGNRPIRVTFDDGRLEIMSPLREHEK